MDCIKKNIQLVWKMYESCKVVVKCAVNVTVEFKVEVGLHQALALSFFLFAVLMDRLTDKIREESLWIMMSADDIVIFRESRQRKVEHLEVEFCT